MKKIIKQALTSTVLIAAIVVAPLTFVDVASADTVSEACKGVHAAGGAATCDGDKLEKFLKNIVNILLFVIGTISVIMIIVGGLRYVLSGGDANSIKAGKDTVIYAIIGLVVSIMAYAIINFVIGGLNP